MGDTDMVAENDEEMTESKVCHCGKIFYRKPKLCDYEWKKRKSCSHECANARKRTKGALSWYGKETNYLTQYLCRPLR